MPSNKVQPLVQAGLNFVRADDTTNVKPVDCASRKYHEHQQTAYRLSAKQGAALSQVENKHRQKLAQEAPVVLAQLEASAKSKIAAQLAASVGLATPEPPEGVSSRTNTPHRQHSLPVLHSSTWFKWRGHPKHSISAVWPASSNTVQQTAGSWAFSNSPGQAATMNHSAAACMGSEPQWVGVPSLARLGPQQQQAPQVCVRTHTVHQQVVPDVAALPLTRAAWQQEQGSIGQSMLECGQQKHEQCSQMQLPLLQPQSTAQACTCCAAGRQLVPLPDSGAFVCSSSSCLKGYSWDVCGCSGLSTSMQPSLPGSTGATVDGCVMQPPSCVSVADTVDSCCLETDHELQPLLGQSQHTGSRHAQETHSPLTRRQVIITADSPEAGVPGRQISGRPPCGVPSKHPASPVAQVLMTCHAAAVAALGSGAASVGPDPMLEPLLTSGSY